MSNSYLTPHHVGISVANMEAAINWYEKYLDFQLLWCQDFLPIQTKIAFLQHGAFRIELFEHHKTRKIANHRKFPLKDIQYQGTKHICFIMDTGLAELYARLETQGADIAMSLRLSPPKDALMCFIRDNTGNLIEIIQLIKD
jgi:methylmalonyl-CoA/ethylmalonyl-CoA epimerase